MCGLESLCSEGNAQGSSHTYMHSHTVKPRHTLSFHFLVTLISLIYWSVSIYYGSCMCFSVLFSLSSVTPFSPHFSSPSPPLSLFGHPFVVSLFPLFPSLYKKTESGVCVCVWNCLTLIGSWSMALCSFLLESSFNNGDWAVGRCLCVYRPAPVLAGACSFWHCCKLYSVESEHGVQTE